MQGPSSAANGIEAATALLQSELSQLEEQQEALQKQLQSVQTDLAAISGKAESIRGALAALSASPSEADPRSLSPQESTPASTAPVTVPSAQAGPAVSEDVEVPQDSPVAQDGEQVAPGTEPAAHRTNSKAASSDKLVLKGSRFTDEVIDVLARNPRVALRARDVAQALGRDEDSGSINAVRSTLDRLVATSRAQRAGRGLYQAPVA
ncbi:hypothetical protein ACFVHR_35395 [Streptomyces sp. NPDC127168]|uniref:hypothetical protein n=1 Tax=unclassified Streptomyces TaxID=2593676 RepID=UPI0036356DBD